MVAFGHSAVGAATGVVLYNLTGQNNPWLGAGITLGVSVGLHYVADLIPHGHFFRHREYKRKVKYAIIFDLALSLFTFTFLAWWIFGFGWELIYVILGLAGAQLPDVLDGFIYTGKIPNRGLVKVENQFHQATHWHGKLDKALLLGKRDLWQLAVIVIAFIMILTS